MDHLGMGRSDKPIDPSYYTYQGHVDRLYEFIMALRLTDITAFVQDWGSVIGLNVIGNHPELFARVVVGDGALPLVAEGETLFELPEDAQAAQDEFHRRMNRIPAQQPAFYDESGNPRFSGGAGSDYFAYWILYARNDERFRASWVLEAMTYFPLTSAEEAAYDAPFPARIAMGGPRSFPGLVNELGGATQSAWEGLRSFEKPFLTIWASSDFGNLGTLEAQQILIDGIPGSAEQPHTRLPEASHFLQDDQGPEIAQRINQFIDLTSVVEAGES
jgi:haloalkane dehalogenase